jgi:hypothetical protein
MDSLIIVSLQLQLDSLEFLPWKRWVNHISNYKSEPVQAATLSTIKSNNPVSFWNVDQNVPTTISTKFRRFVTLVRDKCQQVNTSSPSVFYLSHMLAIWHRPFSIGSSCTSNCWTYLGRNTIAQVQLQVDDLTLGSDLNLLELNCCRSRASGILKILTTLAPNY